MSIENVKKQLREIASTTSAVWVRDRLQPIIAELEDASVLTNEIRELLHELRAARTRPVQPPITPPTVELLARELGLSNPQWTSDEIRERSCPVCGAAKGADCSGPYSGAAGYGSDGTALHLERLLPTRLSTEAYDRLLQVQPDSAGMERVEYMVRAAMKAMQTTARPGETIEMAFREQFRDVATSWGLEADTARKRATPQARVDALLEPALRVLTDLETLDGHRPTLASVRDLGAAVDAEVIRRTEEKS